MSWVKLDDQFPDHPKVLKAGYLAAWLYTAGVCYAARYLTDGFIPASKALRLTDIPDPAEHTARLVAVGLWEPVEDGYQIHDYHDYNPSATEVKAYRAADAQRKALGRQNRWRTDDGFQPDSAARPNNVRAESARTPNGIQSAVRPESDRPVPVPVPVPGPVPIPSGSPTGEDGARAHTNGTATAVATRPSRPKAAPQPPPPEELQAFHVVLDGLPGYAPTTPFFEKVLAKYSALDLEEQAIRMADWLRRKHDRQCSAAFITNWLGDELEKLEARNHERNGQYDGLRGSPIAAAVDEDTAEFERAYRRKYGAPA